MDNILYYQHNMFYNFLLYIIHSTAKICIHQFLCLCFSAIIFLRGSGGYYFIIHTKKACIIYAVESVAFVQKYCKQFCF